MVQSGLPAQAGLRPHKLAFHLLFAVSGVTKAPMISPRDCRAFCCLWELKKKEEGNSRMKAIKQVLWPALGTGNRCFCFRICRSPRQYC